MSDLPQDLAIAAAALRELGWTLIPPPAESIPEPQPGEVWRSARPRVEPRTVVEIRTSHNYPYAGYWCVFFTTPKRPPHKKWGPVRLPAAKWHRWAEETGARPLP